MTEPIRGMKEALARVLEDPTRDSVRDMLRGHTGEAANLDFKAEWPADEKLARHVLALGNSGGGCIVVGVAENADRSLEPVGLTALKDKADITKKLNSLVPEALMRKTHVDDFAYDASEYGALNGKLFQIVSVLPDAEHLPFVAERGNADARIGAVYVRRGTESVEASQAELQRIINERIATGHSTEAAMKLDDHLDQLQVLQDRIPKHHTHTEGGIASIMGVQMAASLQGLQGMLGRTVRKANPDYPSEDVRAFIRRMFEAKKRRIARDLDVLP